MRLLFLFSTLFTICKYAISLDCMQCGNYEAWYSEEEHERRIEACRQGMIAPTRCTNSSHTHCIVNWYRTGGSSEQIVTQRHCGTSSEVTGCTLYNSNLSRKNRRHLLNQADSNVNLRKETVTSFVEVCSTACPFGECVNSSPSIITIPLLIFSLYFLF